LRLPSRPHEASNVVYGRFSQCFPTLSAIGSNTSQKNRVIMTHHDETGLLEQLISWIQSTGIRDPVARLRGRGINAAQTFRTILSVSRRDTPESSNRAPTVDEIIQCDLPAVAWRKCALIAPSQVVGAKGPATSKLNRRHGIAYLRGLCSGPSRPSDTQSVPVYRPIHQIFARSRPSWLIRRVMFELTIANSEGGAYRAVLSQKQAARGGVR
jgi:hypothetical protein